MRIKNICLLIFSLAELVTADGPQALHLSPPAEARNLSLRKALKPGDAPRVAQEPPEGQNRSDLLKRDFKGYPLCIVLRIVILGGENQNAISSTAHSAAHSPGA